MANYKDSNVNNVQFNDIAPVIQLKTNGSKLTRGSYALDNAGNIIAPQKVINAIDIDWNSAQITGIEGNIDSTAQLLGLIGQLNNLINSNSQSVESFSETISSYDSSINSIRQTVSSYDSSINSIRQATDAITEYLNNLDITGGGGDGYNHVILTEEEYNALESYNPKTIYFVIGDGEEYEEPVIEENGELINVDNNINTVLNALYVNDGVSNVLHNESQIVLEAGKKYTLSGSLTGSILIDTTQSGVPTDNTELVLNNVTLINKTNNFGIKYLIPENGKGYKDLVITLAPKSKNYIICTKSVQIANDQPGAIYSTNNLTIQGAGYLACYNLGGHGIRGSELKLLAPHIYVHSIHDALHAKKMYICGGTYYINHANDAFGTGIGGKILYAFGKVYINELDGKIFNAKSGEVDNVIKEGKLINVENFDITFLGNLNNYISTQETNILDLYNTAVIQEYDNEAQAKIGAATGTDVEIINGVYQVTKPYIFAAGLINKPINIPNTMEETTLFLQDAVISTREIVVSDNTLNNPSVLYQSKNGQIKIHCLNDSYNVIINNCVSTSNNGDADAIKSEHNIDVEIKNNAFLYINSKAADGIDGTDVNITDSKGTLMIHKCGERGIKGTNIIIGPKGSTPLGRLTLITSPNNDKYSTFDGAAIITDNCQIFGNVIPVITNNGIMTSTGYADIFARKGSGSDKGSLYITNNELNGVLVCKSIGAIILISADNANNLYYNEVIAHGNMQSLGIPEANNDTYFAYAYNNYHIPYIQ